MLTSPEAARDRPKLAVIVIVLAVLTLSLGDALIKETSAEMVLWQIFVLRSLLAIPVLLFILRSLFASVSLRPRALGWTVARSLMLVLMWIAYYASLPHLQLSLAAAAYYTAPIFITLFSARFVGEKVGPAGWFATFLGFCGVVIILRPAADDFSFYALLPLMAATLYAGAMILTRTKCRGEHPLILSGALNVAFVAVGLSATLLGGGPTGTSESPTFLSAAWAPMGRAEIIAIVLLAVAILVGSIGAAVAYQVGPSSVVATFDFAYVAFAVIWGFLFFSEVPDAQSLAGMAMIVTAGVIAVRR